MTALPDPTRPIEPPRMADAIGRIVDGEVEDRAIAAFLLALAERGETASEVAAAAGALRQRMVRVTAPEAAIDVCGTGGDGSHSLNVSTAAAFVVAAAGVPVAKHGNRGQSSRTGTADVLAAIGVPLDLPVARLEAALHEVGIAFLFAQRHHPAIARVAPVRRALGRRTIFNLLGPLANPAGVRRQMIGVFAEAWVRSVAEAAVALGSDAVLAVHGGGLDEIALHAPSTLAWMRGGQVRMAAFDPAAHGIVAHPLADLAGGEADENAAALRAMLAGEAGTPTLAAYRAIVTVNAAAALKLAGRAQSWRAALALAEEQIASGAAADRLAQLVAFR